MFTGRICAWTLSSSVWLIAHDGVAADSAPKEESAPRSAYLRLGTGWPEVVHVDAGWFASKRLTLDAVVGWLAFNPMLGLGASTYWPLTSASSEREQAVLLSARVRLNAALDDVQLRSSGERIGSTAEAYLGYQSIWERWLLRAEVGAIILQRKTLEVGPNLQLSAGYVF